jgi:hypothetical protein
MTFIKQAGYDNALALLGLHKISAPMMASPPPDITKGRGQTIPTGRLNTGGGRKAPLPPLGGRKPANVALNTSKPLQTNYAGR